MLTLDNCRRVAVGAGVALLVAGLGACSSSGQRDDIRHLVRKGEYGQAVRKAEKLVQDDPDSENAQRIYREARTAYLVDQCRRVLFDERPEEALAILERAEAEYPGHPVVVIWTQKVKVQLTEEWLDRANDHLASRQLDLAGTAFERALLYDENSLPARLGLSRVLLTQNYRRGQSRSYYTQGIRDFRDYLLHQAKNNLDKSVHFDVENTEADRRREQVRMVMVDDRLASARSLEERAFFFAARNEYRLTLVLDPGSAEAKQGLNRMDNEVRAQIVLDAVGQDFRRGDLVGAEASLDRAEFFTDRQQDDFQVMRGQIEDARLRDMYEVALALEHDYEYEAAVRAYSALLEEADHFEDAIARKTYLEGFIQRAHELYAIFLETDSDAERLGLLREIDLLWPEFKDVPERIESFEARAQQLYEMALRADAKDVKEFLKQIQMFYPDYKDVMERLGELGRPRRANPIEDGED